MQLKYIVIKFVSKEKEYYKKAKNNNIGTKDINLCYPYFHNNLK